MRKFFKIAIIGTSLAFIGLTITLLFPESNIGLGFTGLSISLIPYAIYVDKRR